MNWEFYMNNLPAFGGGSCIKSKVGTDIGFVADVDYTINDSPTKVFVGIDGSNGKPYIAQIGHIWHSEENPLRVWGMHYYRFSKDGELIGEQNGPRIDAKLTRCGENVRVSSHDIPRLVTTGRDLGKKHRALAPSLDKCIVSIEESQK